MLEKVGQKSSHPTWLTRPGWENLFIKAGHNHPVTFFILPPFSYKQPLNEDVFCSNFLSYETLLLSGENISDRVAWCFYKQPFKPVDLKTAVQDQFRKK